MPADQPHSPPKLIDAAHAPELFADGVSGFFVQNGNLHIAFEASRADHALNPAPIRREIVARIVMPAAGARALAISLFDFLKKMGLDPGNVTPSVALRRADEPAPAEAPVPVQLAPQPAPAQTGVIDRLDAPELFAEGIAGFYLHAGVLRIAFETVRFDHSTTGAPATRVLVARIALPAPGASSLAVNLFDFLKKMGIDPASVSAVPTMQ
jgi:hypothetical protein